MEQIRTPVEEDNAAEAAVLQQLLALHPIQLSFEELLRELGEGDGFAGRDAIERAVHDLEATGLLHRNCKLLVPSRAALRFEELLCG